jgi:hypothetical protein
MNLGFMEKMFEKCTGPSHTIDTQSPILAKAISPTVINSELFENFFFFKS